ncbi:unnamed protein product [Rotaria sp. Silwood2]|nr:unnamed protein product [Rotaria sp. Silwood2]CAF4048179.1 unnamed protein product [Rotaria sp. Silwood2]
MTSLFNGEQEENLFVHNEQPSANLQQTENFDGIKSIKSFENPSSITSTPILNQQRQPYRSSSFQLSSQQTRYTNSNDSENRFILWQKEYDRKIEQMNEIKTTELNKLKFYYETRLHELEDNNKHLEIISGQINEENKRLKIEIEHEQEQNKIEQKSLQQHLKEFKNTLERKIHEIKFIHENDKQEIKQQHSRIYQDLLDETNQRLKKMENNYKYEQLSNESVIDEMEKRMVDLRSNFEHLQQLKQKLEDDKIQLIKTNEQLQLQIQELTNKQRHIDRDHADKIQRYENELKSVHLRCESSIDFLHKENDILKSKSTKTIDDLENKLSKITEHFHNVEKSFEQKLNEQQIIYHNNIKQYENDYEKRLQILKQELKEQNNKSLLSIQHNQQIQNELRQQKHQIKIDLENQIQEINNKTRENEQILINKLKHEYEQANQQDQEKLRENFNKEIDEIKRKYEQIIERKDEKIKNDLQKFNQLSVETKHTHEIEKQQIINEYEQFIQKLENNYTQKADEYEKRIEVLISKTHEQLKTMEDEFEVRHGNQQLIISDQHKIIQAYKDEEHHAKIVYEKQCKMLSEQSIREKNEIKTQFDICMKNLEKNFNILASKKEQLERKLSYLKEQHKHEMIECRLSYENNIKGLLSNDVRLDLENTIQSLKQQVIYLQQRTAFLQQELEQYIEIYGHRLSSQQ